MLNAENQDRLLLACGVGSHFMVLQSFHRKIAEKIQLCLALPENYFPA